MSINYFESKSFLAKFFRLFSTRFLINIECCRTYLAGMNFLYLAITSSHVNAFSTISVFIMVTQRPATRSFSIGYSRPRIRSAIRSHLT